MKRVLPWLALLVTAVGTTAAVLIPLTVSQAASGIRTADAAKPGHTAPPATLRPDLSVEPPAGHAVRAEVNPDSGKAGLSSAALAAAVKATLDPATAADPDAYANAAAAAERAQAKAMADNPDSAQASPAPAKSSPSTPADLDASIRGWIQALSKEQGYEGWKSASYTVEPVGPGMHSWLVTVADKGRSVGYMIVGATRDNHYSLVEYGTGDKPLFSMQTLYQSMVQRELIDQHTTLEAFQNNELIHKKPLYLGPLKSFWKVTIRHDVLYFDAKSGQLMPNLDEEVKGWKDELYTSDSRAPRKVQKDVQLQGFDPLERSNWLKGKPMKASASADITGKLEQLAQITFSAKLFGRKLTYPLAAIGFQVWDEGDPFIELAHDGARAVPFSLLTAIGQFYD